MNKLDQIKNWLTGLPLLLWPIMVLALALRLYQLNESGLWTDEAFSVMLAREPFMDMIQGVTSDGVHPPFFYFLLFPWVALFGDTETAVRSLSVVAGILTVYLTWFVGRRFYDDNTGLIAAFLVATSSFYIFYSQEARMYIFMAPAALLSFYFLHGLLADRRRSGFIGYFISTQILLYTHIFGVFYVFAQNVWYLGLMMAGRGDRPTLRQWVLMQGVTVLAFLPWLPFVFGKASKQRDGGSFWLEAPGVQDILEIFISFAGSTAGLALAILVFLAAAVSFLTDRLEYHAGRDGTTIFRLEGLLLLWAFVPILVSALYSLLADPILYPRYVLPSALPFYILLAAILGKWISGSGYVRVVVAATVGLLTIYQTFIYYSDGIRMNHYRLPHDWRAAGELVARSSDPDTAIVCPGACRALDYYLRNVPGRSIKVPILNSEMKNIDNRIERVSGDLAPHDRVWLVVPSDRDAQGLMRNIAAQERISLQSADIDGLLRVELFERVNSAR